MRHATQATLDTIEDLLQAVRQHGQLQERKRGAFYLKSIGFLHFHEDPAGLFADLKIAGREWQRLQVDTPSQREELLARIEFLLA